MKQRITSLITALAIVATAVALPLPAFALTGTGQQIQNGVNQISNGPSGDLTLSVKNVVNVLLFALGMIAVIMIVIGGFRYVLSGGDSSSITAAKNTIFYAVIGLVVAILAFAIVNFVLASVK